MQTPLSYLLSLRSIAQDQGFRYLVRLIGSERWQADLIGEYCTQSAIQRSYKLGGVEIGEVKQLSYKQGSLLLGQEIDCLIYDDSNGFDANSLTAASGALCRGGIFFLLLSGNCCNSYQWVERHSIDTIVITQSGALPALPHLLVSVDNQLPFAEQKQAVSLIKQVLLGHRKRPLVLTADRGRGKSAALGIAAAQLISERTTKILLTAPSRKSVDSVFLHAKSNLHSITALSNNTLVSGNSFIQFVSPDELLRDNVECDLLFVDEASAIPVSMLIHIVSRYHRTVFSSTIHGYEGCGRGFKVKFFKWLDLNRPNWKTFHIHQPVRWNVGDPLETWIFDTFLLNCDSVDSQPVSHFSEAAFRLVNKSELLNNSVLFRKVFSILVNAHYQTSPNDMVQILDDESVHVFIATIEGEIVGCLVVKQEGKLELDVIESIQIGKRRPKGHLVAALIAGQLGIIQAAEVGSLRVMRIAVIEPLQGSGIGSQMLSYLIRQTDIKADYISTSFGLTRELFQFWASNNFSPVRLGSRLEPASGTHSLVMLHSLNSNDWVLEVAKQFPLDLVSMLPETFSDLPADLVIELLKSSELTYFPITDNQFKLIQSYILGGSCYENVAHALTQCLFQYWTETYVPPVVISKLLQRKSWSEIASLYSLVGQKAAEQFFKQQVGEMLKFTL
ncbi:GNAT family N-acetyltransferase [Vibrio sp. TH_r3]|uniref:GNAT family N-acetyltransferase n=1 Tax=Vibrio sp. TH_r3 TaxID=3082084 RepID=UPI002953D854|nr:GNAT family N-acetyltransferase [Vibrio sp. TH_r3]MDV7104860.1 GNAT family N-acetyltransferase [Vibrio sp. TH_r3]